MDSTATATQPLTDRSTNTHLQPSTEKLNDLKAAPANMTSMEYHRQVLHGKLENGEKNNTSYVSPSDDIMSPCSKKLSDLKGKRFKNVGKSQQSLFAKLGKKNFEQSALASSETASPNQKEETAS
ncbi:Spo12 family [Aspergillus sclerotialis]|uniref:Spo12 family n=1 Tax=Aspergillus sclerotialis TaxID=2070753 RepID=A0A3A2ZJV8_9EURO|nr:Spo12 family [Aspergillus sclerotialis]